MFNQDSNILQTQCKSEVHSSTNLQIQYWICKFVLEWTSDLQDMVVVIQLQIIRS